MKMLMLMVMEIQMVEKWNEVAIHVEPARSSKLLAVRCLESQYKLFLFQLQSVLAAILIWPGP